MIKFKHLRLFYHGWRPQTNTSQLYRLIAETTNHEPLNMKRVFLGINLSDDLKSKIEDLKKQYDLFSLPIKLVEPRNSHIAIKFLDDLTDEQIEQINKLTKECTDMFRNFEVTVKNVLVFPDMKTPRILALKAISANLSGLAKKLSTSFEQYDFIQTENRPYAPHITLGRINEKLSDQQTEIIKNIEFADKFYVDAIQLFESRLTSDGPIYNVLKNFKLR